MRQVGNYPLWIGTARDARDVKSVLGAGIRAIVDLAAEELPASPTRDLVYLRFPLVDNDGNDSKLLRAMLDSMVALLRTRLPTLVACGVGMSRSPAVAAVAFATAHHLNLAEVLTAIPGPRDVSPVLLRELEAVGGSGMI